VSIDMMNRVWWREDLKTMEKFVALALADAAGDDGACYPSIARIAKKCSCVPRTVQTALKGLESKRLIKRFRRTDRTDYFQMVIGNWPQQTRPPNTVKESKFGLAETRDFDPDQVSFLDDKTTGAGYSPPSKTGVQDIPLGVQDIPNTGAGDSPNTLEEPLEEPLDIIGANGKELVVSTPDLGRFIEERWAQLKQDHPQISGLRRMTDTLLKLAREQANQNAQAGETAIDVWDVVFSEIPKSDFLLGKIPPGQGRTARYKLTMSHLVKPHMFRRVINGDFDRDAESVDPNTGEIMGPAAAATSKTVDRLRQIGERQRN